jgi:hypothetical protein
MHDGGEVDDHGHEPVTGGVAGVSPAVLVHPDHNHSLQPCRACGGQQFGGCLHREALIVSQDRPSSRAIAATDTRSAIKRRSTNRAHLRVVVTPGRTSRDVSRAKITRSGRRRAPTRNCS